MRPSGLDWPEHQPTLTGDRVVLRPWCDADVPQIAAACQDADIGRFTRVPQPYRHSDAVEFVAGQPAAWRGQTSASFAVTVASDPVTVVAAAGLVGIDARDQVAEVGYWTVPAHRGTGYATEAAELVSCVALTAWGLARVELLADVANAASLVVAQRAGFVREGTARDRLLLVGERHDAAVFSRIRADLG